VILIFEVSDKETRESEFFSQMIWEDCGYADVTFLEDVILRALGKTIKAGYAHAAANGASAEMIQAMKSLAE
jgi:hypothetical protein